MYTRCIFCSASLGRNEALEAFPVGARVAFDAHRGRLWAVCPGCGRWNLAPMEERWEPVEQAERLFRDARLRVQSANVGLARLPDGTRLVRVGDAIPGELAAWRYGGQLLRRRRRYLAGTGLAVTGGIAIYGGIAALGMSTGIGIAFARYLQRRGEQRVIYRVPAHPDGAAGASRGGETLIRRWHIGYLDLLPPEHDAGFAVHVRDGRRDRPGSVLSRAERAPRDDLVLHGAQAQALMSRAMVRFNRAGATRHALDAADRLLADAGSAERLLRQTAERRATLSSKAAFHARALHGPAALAFEMALHEASERRALEGELAALEAAWKEAEEIAAIADALPGEALVNRMLDRLIR